MVSENRFEVDCLREAPITRPQKEVCKARTLYRDVHVFFGNSIECNGPQARGCPARNKTRGATVSVAHQPPINFACFTEIEGNVRNRLALR